ncbi:MAG: LysR family transcriptional regulator [Hyphomicrobiales bacterium]|nr:LysR family transcriptional regulator [Hyphomicrobiales bacterium]
MNITLKKLAYALAVARHRSIAKAARELNVSPSAVAAAVDALEAELGSRLFHRQPARGVVATSAGREILARAARLLEEVEAFKAFAAERGQHLAGELNVGCFTSLSFIVLPPVLKAFTGRHPGITVHLHEGEVGEIQDLLDRGEVDLILTYDVGLRPDLERRVLAAAPPHAVFAGDDPMARAPRVRLRDLADRPMILFDQPASRDYFRDLFAAAGCAPRVVYRTESYQTLCELVGSGLGYALLNLRPPHDLTYHGYELARRPLADPAPAPRLVLAHRKRADETPIISAFSMICQRYIMENINLFTVDAGTGTGP